MEQGLGEHGEEQIVLSGRFYANWLCDRSKIEDSVMGTFKPAGEDAP